MTAFKTAGMCWIDSGALIGDGTEIWPGVAIHDGVTIGLGCEIKANAVIGGMGFGYERVGGRWELRDHSCGVQIDDDVHIGSGTCIDRGRHRNTWIQRGTKIDNLVHVAHNVVIGEDVIVVAGAEISGSCTIGDGAWIGPNACIRQGVTVGAGAMVGIGSVVLKDVPANAVVAGNPARYLRERTEADT